MKHILTILENYVVDYGFKVLSAILILVIGLWLAKLISKIFNKFILRSNVDLTLVKFFTSLVRIVLIIIVVIAAVNKLGVETTSLVAVLGAAGLAIGLALQGSLSNLASGIMLIIFRPIKVGDYIQGGGGEGVVKEIGIFVTKLTSIDNKLLFIPNSKLTSDNITNFTFNETRRVDMIFGIGYKSNIEKAKNIIKEVLDNNSKVLKEPAPDIFVRALADSSVNISVRPWCKTEDYWTVISEVTETIKLKFDANGIEIPFPQRDIHLYNN
ncbi:MAG: mechanosensitive ion channel [Ignavibacteriales bacterium]|nr:mechanosensitive ion channel [Ignavibacteriales bacterium]